jgi:hypothetical protein
MRDENPQRAIEYVREVAVGDHVAEQILRATQRLVAVARDGELDLEALRRERDDAGTCRRKDDDGLVPDRWRRILMRR